MVRTWMVAGVLALGLTGMGSSAEPNAVWVEDVKAAKQTARQQRKDLLILFTGSDWCPWCKRLDAEVLSQRAFAETIPQDYVLLKLDFPRTTPQPAALRRQNEQLLSVFKEKYRFSGYPTIYLADANGVPYAQSGYEEGGAEKVVQYLTFLRTAKNIVDPGATWIEDFRVALAKAQGLQRHLLILFTGSDWCPYCMRLDKQVLSTETFKKEASKDFIFLKLDFPRTTPQDALIRAQNKKLDEFFTSKFGLQGYPTIYLADPTGIPYAQTGLNDMGPKAYVENLRRLRTEHIKELQKAAAEPNRPNP